MTDPLREPLPSTLAGACVIERELGGFVAEESALGRAVLERFLLEPEQLYGWAVVPQGVYLLLADLPYLGQRHWA